MYWEYIFYYVFGYIDCVGLAIPLLVFAIMGKKIKMPGKRAILLYYILFFILTMFASYLNYKELYNNWVYDTIPLFLSIPLYFFFRELPNSTFGKRLSLLSLLLFILYYVFTWQTAIDLPLNTEYYLYFAIFILINVAGYLLEELKLMREGLLFNRIEFWMVASLLFYACVCALMWSFFAYLTSHEPEDFLHYGYIWSICHNLTLFISCTVFSLVLYRKFR